MNEFARRIRPYVRAELVAAEECEKRGDSALGFKHLERAHVLGQASTLEHVRVHIRMLRWALRHRDAREIVGQMARVFGAATMTAIGFVPTGNTGGADVSPWRRLAVPPDVADLIALARERPH